MRGDAVLVFCLAAAYIVVVGLGIVMGGKP